ncbi:MAG: TolC family protein [Chlorobiaceae bacterium]
MALFSAKRSHFILKRIFRTLCSAALLSVIFPAPGFSLEQNLKSLSLNDCIRIAVDNATSKTKAENNLKLQGADVVRSYGSFLPKVSSSASYTPYSISRTYSSISGINLTRLKTESRSANFTITTSLNLFNGFADYAALRSALQRESAARFTLDRALQSIVFDVTQAYYQVLLDRELLGISRENLLSAEDQLTLTERQYQVGLKSTIDRYQQQADAAQSRLSVIKAETRMEHSMLELLRRLGIDGMQKVDIAPQAMSAGPSLPVKVNIDSLVTIAMERRSDLKGSSLEASAANWQVTEARAAWLPRLDLVFTTGSSGTTLLSGSTYAYPAPPISDQLKNSIGYALGLNLSWSIFDGFQTRYNVQSAKIQHVSQELDYHDLTDSIKIDIQEAAGEYASAWRQIDASKVSLNAASSAFEGIKRKYELGAAGFTELSAARAALFNARSSLSQANFNLALQKSVLDYTTGTLWMP